jgi:hypothetical protein
LASERDIDDEESEEDSTWEDDDLVLSGLPSWIPDLSRSAFGKVENANGGLELRRRNADPLVGVPIFSGRCYAAAGVAELNLNTLFFKKWEDSYSIFVDGFIVDEIRGIEDASQLGNIPWPWVKLGRWKDFAENPPDDFWQTLVAGRNSKGQNPKPFWRHACKMAFSGLIAGNALETGWLIEEAHSPIVADFLARVQATVWNRRLMRTKHDLLGLVPQNAKRGDLICILPGCSVPVALRRVLKSAAQSEEEQVWEEDVKRRVAQRLTRAAMNRRRLPEDDPQNSQRPASEKGDGGPQVLTADDGNSPAPENEASWSFRVASGAIRATSGIEREAEPSGILREEKGFEPASPYYYKLVGECYVHGMMDGEAIQNRNLEPFLNWTPNQSFDLR